MTGRMLPGAVRTDSPSFPRHPTDEQTTTSNDHAPPEETDGRD
ncbi:hypothetical protein [Haladaptatus cibarius]|nr:hypothetical protein [Haladaptatus cibarius]